MIWIIRRDRMKEEAAALEWPGAHQRFIVRAPDEAMARRLAADWDGSEHAHLWLDSKITRAVTVDPAAEPMVLMAERK